MEVAELKRALVEIRSICVRERCRSCPFRTNAFKCKLRFMPIDWDIDDFEEDSNATY